MLKPRIKNVDFDLKLKLNGKRLYPTKSVKYLDIKIDESLTWNEHINDIPIKLNRANAMLYKVREFVKTRVLKLIYHAIFDCHLNYVNGVWGQNKNSLNRLFLLQKKGLRIISLESGNVHSNSLFYRHEIVKLHDKIIIENIFFLVNLLILIFHQFSIICLPFSQTLIGTKHHVLQKDSLKLTLQISRNMVEEP